MRGRKADAFMTALDSVKGGVDLTFRWQATSFKIQITYWQHMTVSRVLLWVQHHSSCRGHFNEGDFTFVDPPAFVLKCLYVVLKQFLVMQSPGRRCWQHMLNLPFVLGFMPNVVWWYSKWLCLTSVAFFQVTCAANWDP